MFLDLIIFMLFLAIMFVPTFVAYHRKLKRKVACLVINILFGWTIIFWIPILMWSMLSSATENQSS